MLVAATVAALLAASFLTGYLVGRGDPLFERALPLRGPAAGNGQPAPGSAPDGTGLPPAAAPPADLGRVADPFWETWNFAEQEHVRRPVDRLQLVRGAVKGLLQTLGDQHAAFLDPIANRAEKAALDGTVEGIGTTVELRERRHTILAPVEDGPAVRAGLRTGDVILRIDGREVGALSLADVVALLRGPSGSRVKVTVLHPDEPDAQPVEVEVTRARLELETVSSRMLADGIGYIRVRVLGTQTVPQLARALREMRGRRVRGIILDLRDNPGGYLNTAVDVASHFVKDGKVLYYEVEQGQQKGAVSRPGGLATDLTLAVLVNRGTASAAEIVAGALRDHERAYVIGESTFGKGSVQATRDLSDGSAIRVTSGSWLTPNGRSVDGRGLEPQLAVKPAPEDERAKRDVILERALEWFNVAPTPTPTPAPGPTGG